MKRNALSFLMGIISMLVLIGVSDMQAYAANDTIVNGISIGGIDVSGMSEDEARQAVNDYMSGYTTKIFTLDMDGQKVDVTAGELGYYWRNTEVIEEAVSCCKKGNLITRYEEAKDIEKDGISFDLDIDVNDTLMEETINDRCGEYCIPHKNASLKRVGGAFEVTKEASGKAINMEQTVAGLHDYMMNTWDGKDASYTIMVEADEPVATVEDCEKVKDLIGTYSTTFSTSSSNYNRNKNMENGVMLLDGITLCMGETMSVNSYLEPWTADNGWYMAGTYVNGKVENSLGGGICQVSSTLYNALILAELEIVERYPHSMSVGYVPLSQDAALAGTWKDLKVKNNTDTPIYIEGIYSSGRITFNIYGVETRPSNRTIEFKSETISSIPSQEVVKEDPTKPAGYREVTSSGHTGYKARLIKYVYVDGVKQSEEVFNTSTYAASPTYVTVGTGPAEAPTEAPAEPQSQSQTQAETKPTEKPSETTKPEEVIKQEKPDDSKVEEGSGGTTEATTGSTEIKPTEKVNVED